MTTSEADAQKYPMTDGELDSILAAADSDLLGYVRASTDRHATLVALMADSEQGSTGRLGGSSRQTVATVVLGARALIAEISRLVNSAPQSAFADCSDANDDDLVGALAPDRVWALALDRALGSALSSARRLLRSLDLAFSIAWNLIAEADPSSERGLACALALDLAVDSASASATDLDLAIGRTKACGSYRSHDAGRALDCARNQAQDGLTDLTHVLAAIHVDVSGTDMSQLAVPDVSVLEGVVWTDNTVWPPHAVRRIRRHSQEIGPGLYMIGAGGNRVPASAVG